MVEEAFPTADDILDELIQSSPRSAPWFSETIYHRGAVVKALSKEGFGQILTCVCTGTSGSIAPSFSYQHHTLGSQPKITDGTVVWEVDHYDR